MRGTQTRTAVRARMRNEPYRAVDDPGRSFSWDAMGRALPREAMGQVAEAVGRSVSLMEKWCRESGPLPEQTGIRNPAAYLHDVIRASVKSGVDFWDAVAPLVWICHKLGLEVVLRKPNINGDRPFVVLRDMCLNAGALTSRLADFLDEKSRGGKHITVEERRELMPVIDSLEQTVRDFRALVDTEAA